jgi:glycosyltransferase involved in cell wall biosynthesis
MLSIIIPTLNEEKYLPLLLESIKRQDYKDYEIIVADNNSTDKTVKIAKQYGCKITKGGLPGPGRNEGAKIAQGELFLFLDADVALPGGSLKKWLEEYQRKRIDIATCLIKLQGKRSVRGSLIYSFYNSCILMLKELDYPAGMSFMLIKKEIHKKIKGFDESIKFGEDTDYLNRSSEFGKFSILKSRKILVSPRRFKNDGWLRTSLKYVWANMYMFSKGPIPIKSKFLEYKFGHYKNNEKIFK